MKHAECRHNGQRGALFTEKLDQFGGGKREMCSSTPAASLLHGTWSFMVVPKYKGFVPV